MISPFTSGKHSASSASATLLTYLYLLNRSVSQLTRRSIGEGSASHIIHFIIHTRGIYSGPATLITADNFRRKQELFYAVCPSRWSLPFVYQFSYLGNIVLPQLLTQRTIQLHIITYYIITRSVLIGCTIHSSRFKFRESIFTQRVGYYLTWFTCYVLHHDHII